MSAATKVSSVAIHTTSGEPILDGQVEPANVIHSLTEEIKALQTENRQQKNRLQELSKSDAKLRKRMWKLERNFAGSLYMLHALQTQMGQLSLQNRVTPVIHQGQQGPSTSRYRPRPFSHTAGR